jgi:hypothetical protein
VICAVEVASGLLPAPLTGGFETLAAPLASGPIKKMMKSDLARLKRFLETRAPVPAPAGAGTPSRRPTRISAPAPDFELDL